MTWYHKGKVVDYDYYGDEARNDVYDYLCNYFGSTEEALFRLMMDSPMHVKEFAGLLAEIQDDPDEWDTLQVQNAIDEFCWRETILPPDDEMEQRRKKKVVVAGETFVWKRTKG